MIDVSALVEDFKAYVVEFPPEPDVILKVTDLANFGVDLEFLNPTERL